jgi:hypothetical protein
MDVAEPLVIGADVEGSKYGDAKGPEYSMACVPNPVPPPATVTVFVPEPPVVIGARKMTSLAVDDEFVARRVYVFPNVSLQLVASAPFVSHDTRMKFPNVFPVVNAQEEAPPADDSFTRVKAILFVLGVNRYVI